MVTINIWTAAAALGAAKAAGFDVDNLIAQFGDVIMGKTSGAAIPAQLAQELVDVVEKFSSAPVETGYAILSAAAVPMMGGVVADWICDALGLPKSVKFGFVTLKFTVTPPKRRRGRGRRRRSYTRRRRASPAPRRRRRKKGGK